MLELPTAAIVVLALAVWELARFLVRALAGNMVQGLATDRPAFAAEEDYPELEIPPYPHVEIALDSPKGLQYGNPLAPYAFENEFCSGSYLFFHPPTTPGVAGTEAYAEYFTGKKRAWEVRVHFRFKQRPPPDEIFFGVELADYVPVNAATKHATNLVVATLRSAAGCVYHSYGDCPAETRGEPEMPVCVLPLWAFDQFIETPAGQEPPHLMDPNFPNLGHKRFKRVAEYAKEIEALGQRLDVGPTYTFSTWGVSRFLDVINWQLLGIPLVTPMDFNRFAGAPPVYVVLYSLKPAMEGDTETRHLHSRKSYYFRAAIWSSLKRPNRSRFDALTGVTMPEFVAVKKKSLRKRLGKWFKGIANACIMKEK